MFYDGYKNVFGIIFLEAQRNHSLLIWLSSLIENFQTFFHIVGNLLEQNYYQSKNNKLLFKDKLRNDCSDQKNMKVFTFGGFFLFDTLQYSSSVDTDNIVILRSMRQGVFMIKSIRFQFQQNSCYGKIYYYLSSLMKLKQLHVKVGLCSLNNDPLDFKNNLRKIMQSIEECKRLNCSIRVGGELEISGYACQDHFLEYDTIFHSWDVIKDILVSGITNGIVAEVGCPILHKAALYNGRVILHNSKVIAIRVKMILADGGNYFETRHFSAWKYPRQVGEFMLPQIIQDVTEQRTVPIGTFIVSFNDTSLAYEICEQSWISNNPMIDAALDGAQIFINVSASEIERGKLKRKLQMLQQFTERHGGAYVYVNIKGGLGARNFFDGCCFFSQNGKIKELSQPFQLSNIQITPITINLNSVRTFRINNKSFQKESHGVSLIPRVRIDWSIATNSQYYPYDSAVHKKQLQRIREIYEFPHATFEPSVYLWDFLRKSKARGFFLPLSGGLDSCTVALIVYNMCFLLCQQIEKSNLKDEIMSDLRRVLRDKDYTPSNPQQLCNKILYTAYLSTSNSSQSTKNRAKKISQTIGCKHRAINFDEIYKSYQDISKNQVGVQAKYKKEGGSWRTDLALQNIQSRSRMVLTYFLASIELQRDNAQGFLLVLGSSNLDESLRGYFTKYDCSSADINPIGSFSKFRLKQILSYFSKMHKFSVIDEVLDATPTAELRPLQDGQIAQTDEQDMGLTYAELCIFGKLRKIQRLGPVSMFDRMYFKQVYDSVDELALKIKRFFTFYGINRHKCSILPPSFHFDPESCDDNRYDMRPFFYATDWSYQFQIIDERVREIKSKQGSLPGMNHRSASVVECEQKLQNHHPLNLPHAQQTKQSVKGVLYP